MSLLITFIPITFFMAIKVVVGDCNNYNHLAGRAGGVLPQRLLLASLAQTKPIGQLVILTETPQSAEVLYYKMHVKSVSGRGRQFATSQPSLIISSKNYRS